MRRRQSLPPEQRSIEPWLSPQLPTNDVALLLPGKMPADARKLKEDAPDANTVGSRRVLGQRTLCADPRSILRGLPPRTRIQPTPQSGNPNHSTAAAAPQHGGAEEPQCGEAPPLGRESETARLHSEIRRVFPRPGSLTTSATRPNPTCNVWLSWDKVANSASRPTIGLSSPASPRALS